MASCAVECAVSSRTQLPVVPLPSGVSFSALPSGSAPSASVLIETVKVSAALVLENSLGRKIEASVRVELIDPQGHVRSSVEREETIREGTATLFLPLPFQFSNLKETELYKQLTDSAYSQVVGNLVTHEELYSALRSGTWTAGPELTRRQDDVAGDDAGRSTAFCCGWRAQP